MGSGLLEAGNGIQLLLQSSCCKYLPLLQLVVVSGYDRGPALHLAAQSGTQEERPSPQQMEVLQKQCTYH